MSEIMDTLLFGKTAFLKHINYSPELQELFETNLKKQGGGSVAGTSHSLSFALHRFDSNVRPLAHFLLGFDAALATAMQTQSLRAGDDYAKDATKFLSFFAGKEGGQNLLQTALMVDAGHMVLDLLRFFDRATFDVALMGEQLQAFVQKLDLFFVRGHIYECDPSFTALALKALATSRLVRINGLRCPTSIGGHVPDRTEPLARMKAFVILAIETVKAEFPSFEPLQGFSAFALRERHLIQDIPQKLRRVAKMCKVSHENLRSQYLRFLPLAVADYRARPAGLTCTTCFESWSHVLRTEARMRRTSMAALAPDLFEALAQLGAFTGPSFMHVCTTGFSSVRSTP